MGAPIKPITIKEQEWAVKLPATRSREFQLSRGYVREALSELWETPSLEIPLHAPPGAPPELPKGWGNVSFSHCCDGLFIGWSPRRIGVDLERADRLFNPEKLTKRYFSQEEIKDLKNLHKEDLRAAVLNKWVIKEAAIKWQKGSLASNISQWNFCPKTNVVIHQSLGHKIGLYNIHYDCWYIAIAYDHNFHKNPPIFCVK